MRAFPILALCFLVWTAAVATAHAQQNDQLIGTWVGETTILLDTGEKIIEAPRRHTFVISEVNGSYLKGYRTWTALEADQEGYVGSTPENEAREPFIGLVHSDGKTIRMVETEDRGMIFCELVGPDRIEMTYMETAPHAVIFSIILEKTQ